MPFHLPHLLNLISNCFYRWGDAHGPRTEQEQALHCFICQPLLTAELDIWVSALLGLQDRTTHITAGTKLLPPPWNKHLSAAWTCWGGGWPSSQHKALRRCHSSWSAPSGCCRARQVFSAGRARQGDLNTCDPQPVSMKAVFSWV